MRLKDHLNKLEYFKITVESGSLLKASEKALIGQPQLTKVIQQLEDILSVKLFHRSAKGVVPTNEGLKLYEFANEVLSSADKVQLSIKSSYSNLKGSIRIGTYDSIARYFFPDFIIYLQDVVPSLDVYLKTGRSHLIAESLAKNELDIAVIVESAEQDSPYTSSYTSKKVYSDFFGLFKSPSLKDDFKKSLIYFDYPANNVKDSMVRFKFKDAILCDNLETVKSLTEQGIGVGLLPYRVAKEGIGQKKLEPFKHPKVKDNKFDQHNISLCHRNSKPTDGELFVLDELERFLSIWSAH